MQLVIEKKIWRMLKERESGRICKKDEKYLKEQWW